MAAVLYYIHDPMCSWCWGHRPVWDALKSRLPETVSVEYVVGGLAPDTDEPMSEQQRQTIQGYWQRVQSMLGTPFNFDFWRDNIPRRSTYMACRAVLAARLQGLDIAMIDAVQRAFYLRALNPSDLDVLQGLAAELSQQGHAIDVARFAADIQSVEIEQMLQAQIALARRLTDRGFPSMVLAQGEEKSAIHLDYRDPQPSLQHIQQLLKP